MNVDVKFVYILFGALISVLLIGVLFVETQNYSKIEGFNKDMNIISNFIVQSVNVEAVSTNFLKGCDIVKDNNTSVVLNCLKPNRSS